jgi:hypothetical protein
MEITMINQNARIKIEKIKMQLKTVEERKFLDHMVDLLEHLLEDNQKLRDRNAELSWSLYPDKSGGQFSDAEILDSYRNSWWWSV